MTRTLATHRALATNRVAAQHRLQLRDMGTSLKFVGVNFVTNQYVLMNYAVAYPLVDYSVELWFKRGNLGNYLDNALYTEENTGTTTPLFRLSIGINGQLTVAIRTDANNLVQNSLSTIRVIDKNWHQLVWTDTNGTANLYIDGVADGTNWNYTRGVTTLNRAALGVQANGLTSRPWNGGIDNFLIYNRVLTPSEVIDAYVSGIRYANNNVLWWKFDEGSGTTATDSSGNGNNGTIVGATYSTDVPLKLRTVI